MKTKFIFVFVLSITFTKSYGQNFPALPNLSNAVKWEQINTTHFRVLYPKGFSSQGQRMANTLEHIYAPVSSNLGREPLRRTDFILQNLESQCPMGL